MEKCLKSILYVVALVTVAVCFLSGFDTQEYKTIHKTHVVSEGQTVWGIATKYLHEQDKFRDIREFAHTIILANEMQGKNFIHPGDVITIPLDVKSSKEATK